MNYYHNWVIQFVIVLGLVIFAASCSTTTKSSRTGKYSTLNKREKSHQKSTEDKSYTYESDKSKTNAVKTEKLKAAIGIRAEIVQSALTYTGTHYRPGGKSPDTGFDCSGFTGYIFTKNGIPVSGSSDKIAQLGKQKQKDKLLPGDLVFFGNKERISHVAIVSNMKPDTMEIVHSTTSAGVKVDNIAHSEYWQSRFLFGIDIISK